MPREFSGTFQTLTFTDMDPEFALLEKFLIFRV